jgi:hypothetical protein
MWKSAAPVVMLIVLLGVGAFGQTKKAPNPKPPEPKKVREYSWVGHDLPGNFHWECPKGWVVFWPEVNIVTGPYPPMCMSEADAKRYYGEKP